MLSGVFHFDQFVLIIWNIVIFYPHFWDTFHLRLQDTDEQTKTNLIRGWRNLSQLLHSLKGHWRTEFVTWTNLIMNCIWSIVFCSQERIMYVVCNVINFINGCLHLWGLKMLFLICDIICISFRNIVKRHT